MPETNNGDPLTVEGALRTIKTLEGLEVGLYQRTEGVTWMIWGLVAAGVYFTFGMAGAAFEGNFPWWGQLLWVPWIAAGVLGTAALWRAAHLAARSSYDRRAGQRKFALYTLTFIGLMLIGVYVLGRFHLFGLDLADTGSSERGLKEPGFVLALMGLGSLLTAFFPGRSPMASRMLLVTGSVFLAAVLVLALVPYPSIDAAYIVQTLAGASVAGGGWFLGGLYLTFKG